MQARQAWRGGGPPRRPEPHSPSKIGSTHEIVRVLTCPGGFSFCPKNQARFVSMTIGRNPQVRTRIFEVSPAGSSSVSKPSATTSSAAMRAVITFSTGKSPEAIIRAMRRPDLHRIAPCRLDGDVLQRPKHCIDLRGAEVQPSLDSHALAPHCLHARGQRRLQSDAFDCHVDANALFASITDRSEQILCLRVDDVGVRRDVGDSPAAVGVLGSETKIVDAPAALAARTVRAPIGPAPETSTVEPAVTRPRSTPYSANGRRLDHRRLIVAQFLWYRLSRIILDHRQLGHTAPCRLSPTQPSFFDRWYSSRFP